jgi:L-alanine-DL-glutamate epimerase-like enolase superfamily enzyme
MKAANDVLVRIHTEQGITGIGEACPFPPITGETQDTNLAAAIALRDVFIGKDPLAVCSLEKEVGALVHSNPSMAAAFETALFDIMGKVAGLPLFRLFGGDNASFETDITTGIDTPRRMAKNARKHAALGYNTLKVKLGMDPDEDIARLRAIRRAVGESVRLRIDANQGWSVPQAVYALNRLAEFEVQFAEQPVLSSDISGLAAVRTQSPIPIMADESLFLPPDALNLIQAGACDYFNIKLMKAGGILNMVRIAHIADAANIKCMVGCMLESSVALTAAAHVVASQSNIIFADLDGNAEHTVDPVIGGMTVNKGIITLPEKPGVGCDVDPAFLKKLRKV